MSNVGVAVSDLEAGDSHSGVLVGHGREQRFCQGLGLLVKGHGDGFSQLDAAAATLLEMTPHITNITLCFPASISAYISTNA